MEPDWLNKIIASSPAFVVDETCIKRRLRSLVELRQASGCKVLYSIKALPLQSVLRLAATQLDGLSVSSLFEAKLARETIGDSGSIHLTTPGLRVDEFAEVAGLCSHISFNSLSQWRSMGNLVGGYSAGLRLNPKLSFADDRRYDPCRLNSKLGIAIDALDRVAWRGKIEGLHFHTVFGREDFAPLIQIIGSLRNKLTENGHELKWLNLGGGYLYSQVVDRQPFIELVRALKRDYGVNVYIEPGNDIVKQAGYLFSTVIDRFDSDGKTVAVLDTSINHLPEVFEYQRSPEIVLDHPGDVPVILAGSTCLAGDIFGEYGFSNIPAIGDRVVFKNQGAYSLIKANRFNGYNLPDIYRWNGSDLRRLKHYDYQDYRRQWSVEG